MRILLVEDEESLRKIIALNLEIEGYEVVWTDDGRKALELADQQHFDLLILDIMLPNLSGYDICENVRLQNSQVGIIFISAKDTSADRIQGLRLGADDYLTKPFSLEELLLRVQQILKRTTSAASIQVEQSMYHIGAWTIDFVTYEATTLSGESHLLTKKEALLLKLLMDRENQVVSRNQILQTVWGYDVYPSTRTIDNFILSFRKYFEEDARHPRHFHSIRGVGYKFTM
jgi:two-component system, OmpR family, alkaline phosphatase synthesis response regulator PhoP